MPPSFSVIGCGRVGSTLARHLTAAGFRPRHFLSRQRASAAAVACCGGVRHLAAFYNRLGAATVELAARRGAVSEELRDCSGEPDAPTSDPLE
jgi:3-hydroxyisobutyrate dehydrogenase-like beta-hydroxyacid dehydrogenase